MKEGWMEAIAISPSLFYLIDMGLNRTKPVFGVSDKARRKPVSSATETSLKIENFACSKYRYDTFQQENNKGADQTVQAGLRLYCPQSQKTGFLSPYIKVNANHISNKFRYQNITGIIRLVCFSLYMLVIKQQLGPEIQILPLTIFLPASLLLY